MKSQENRSEETAADKVLVASQWQLMRWRFMDHKLAAFSLAVLAVFYLVALACEFVAPHNPWRRGGLQYSFAPPQKIHFVDEEGLHFRPFVYGYTTSRDPETLRLIQQVDRTQKYPIEFLQHGDEYESWGVWKADLHLFGIDDQDEMLLLLGADREGRDMLSRVIYGTRISLSIGLVGVVLSLFLGVLLGGVSGYFGGTTDLIIQRMVELLQAIPQIPLWLTLAAALPRDWTPLQVYFGITLVLSTVSWTGVARAVRGKFLSLREEEFVLAAKFLGANELRIIFRHMVPSFTSHLVAVLTLSIPGMILAETSLSFLGLGLRPPTISWGVLLASSQNLLTLVDAPWLFSPGVAIIVAVLAFNFVGDGLRDAVDPYSQ